MSYYLYEDAASGLQVVVRTGMPEAPVELGYGSTVSEAIRDLMPTLIQSAGRDPEGAAIAWAEGAGWFGDIVDLEYVETLDPDDWRQEGGD